MPHAETQPADRLVLMANQIGKFFAHKGETQAPGLIAHHIKQFWDPRMRKAIQEFVAGNGQGLDPYARKAIDLL